MEKEKSYINNHPGLPVKFKLQRKGTTVAEKVLKKKYQDYLDQSSRTEAVVKEPRKSYIGELGRSKRDG